MIINGKMADKLPGEPETSIILTWDVFESFSLYGHRLIRQEERMRVIYLLYLDFYDMMC